MIGKGPLNMNNKFVLNIVRYMKSIDCPIISERKQDYIEKICKNQKNVHPNNCTLFKTLISIFYSTR